jgi:hypothetical protein
VPSVAGIIILLKGLTPRTVGTRSRQLLEQAITLMVLTGTILDV